MGVFSQMAAAQQDCEGSRVNSDTLPPTTEQKSSAWDEPIECLPPIVEEDTHQPTGAAPVTLDQPEQAQDQEQVPSENSGEGETGDSNADADEDSARKAHEEAEAKRKAEWDAKQEAKKAALQEKLDRLASMSDDEVMMAAMEQVGKDTEKITRRNMKDCVLEHIQTKCLEDPTFARKTMNPLKSMINCFRYISRKAWEYVQDELKIDNIQPGPGQMGYGCDIPDGLCYQWAVDYFNDPDAKEDQVKEEEFTPKPYYKKSAKSSGKAKAKKEPTPKKAAEKKLSASKKAEAKKAEPQPESDPDQITLGAFSMPEEKAG